MDFFSFLFSSELILLWLVTPIRRVGTFWFFAMGKRLQGLAWR